MRMPKVSFLLILAVSFLLPYAKMAHGQRKPTPGCCPNQSIVLNESGATLALQEQFVVSDKMLSFQGITWNGHADQLSSELFLNKGVDRILSSRKTLRLTKANAQYLDKPRRLL